MNTEDFYQINGQRAVSETLNGEAIIINLENGNYYSLNEPASILWDEIKGLHNVKAIIQYLASCYDADEVTISKSVAKTIDFLVAENLIQPGQNEAKPLEKQATEKKPFVELEVKRYEDLQEILLADPIHDVDETGWPILKEKA